MHNVRDPNRVRAGYAGALAGLLMSIVVVPALASRAAADGLGLGHGGGLGIGLGGLHVGIGGSGTNVRGGAKVGGGKTQGAKDNTGGTPGGFSQHSGHAAKGDRAANGAMDGPNPAGNSSPLGAPRGHEDGSGDDQSIAADPPVNEMETSAMPAAEPNLMGHNGNAEHVYDDIPPTEAVSTAPSAFVNALGVAGSTSTRTAR